MGSRARPNGTLKAVATKRKRDQIETGSSPGDKRTSKQTSNAIDVTKSWRDVLGEAPSWGRTTVSSYCCSS